MEKTREYYQKYVNQEFTVPKRTEPMNPVAKAEILIFQAQAVAKSTERKHQAFIDSLNV